MGWSNQIPNPFVLGGGGISGEMDVYDSNGILVLLINEGGVFVFSASSNKEIDIEPDDGSGLPAISFITDNSPVGDAARIVGDDEAAGTAAILSSTAYTNSATATLCRAIAEIGPDSSYLAIRRISTLLFEGGYAQVRDAYSELGYQTSGLVRTAVNCDATDVTITGPATGGKALDLGGWQTYSPSWTAATTNPAIGNGSISGRYLYLNKNVILVKVRILFGATTTLGTGGYRITLPVNMNSTTDGNVGVWSGLDNGTKFLAGSMVSTAVNTLRFVQDASGGDLSATAFVAIAGSYLQFELLYEV